MFAELRKRSQRVRGPSARGLELLERCSARKTTALQGSLRANFPVESPTTERASGGMAPECGKSVPEWFCDVGVRLG
jgi:hypothetical protein